MMLGGFPTTNCNFVSWLNFLFTTITPRSLPTGVWRQRAKIKDSVLGDENSPYVHVCASVRHCKNQIKTLSNDRLNHPSFSTQRCCYAHADKDAILPNFFKSLVGISNITRFYFDLGSLMLHNSHTAAQASELSKPYRHEFYLGRDQDRPLGHE